MSCLWALCSGQTVEGPVHARWSGPRAHPTGTGDDANQPRGAGATSPNTPSFCQPSDALSSASLTSHCCWAAIAYYLM